MSTRAVATPDDPRRGESAPETGDETEDRVAILARRALYIASAVAGIGAAVGCGDDKPPPQPCLTVAPINTAPSTSPAPADTETAPQPCLTMMPVEPSASEDAGSPPQPCLSVSRPVDRWPQDAGASDGGPRPRPRPCLSVLPPQR